MSKVKLLPPHVIAKIAAGEVVERPASVVKELLENTIDSGATAIEISLKDAGKTCIRIKDNGSGIDADDLEHIFQRHATSKIADENDLFAIHSLGFRGEALYSIAAVSDIILSTKTKNADSGWEIHLRGGNKIDLKPHAKATAGTEICVQELFFNTPARKKFLKTNTTELNQVLNIVTPFCLRHPRIKFLLKHQDRTLLDLSVTENPRGRIADVLQLNSAHILHNKHTFFDKHFTYEIFLGDMNIRRARRDMQFIFVNGRPVLNNKISFHLNQVYRLIMPQEHVPFFAVFLSIPADQVDANIHPTKKEVKIKDEDSICRILRNACEHTLMQAAGTQQADIASKPTAHTSQETHTIADALKKPKWSEPAAEDDIFSAPQTTRPAMPSLSSFQTSPPPKRKTEKQEFFIPERSTDAREGDAPIQYRKKLETAKHIGTFAHKYLLFESGASLLLVDQHAAQERISYEALIRQMNKGAVEVQRLLAPVMLALSAQEMNVWEEGQGRLEEIGFESTLMDANTIAVHSHPQLIADIERSVRQLLAEKEINTCVPDTVARRACRSSVMTGDRMHAPQVEYQRKALLQCLDPFTCPHGRPIVVEMHMDFLDKQFLRKGNL